MNLNETLHRRHKQSIYASRHTFGGRCGLRRARPMMGPCVSSDCAPQENPAFYVRSHTARFGSLDAPGAVPGVGGTRVASERASLSTR